MADSPNTEECWTQLRSREFPVTVGVTIEVPPPWSEAIAFARKAVGDPLGEVVPAHITLIPSTVIAAADLDGLETHLDRIASGTPAFTVRLRGTGSFRPISEVAFIHVVQGAEECDALAHKLRRGPIVIESRFPYHAHVTIAQDIEPDRLDAAQRDLADFEAEFKVASILLSTHGTPDVPAGTTVPWTPRRNFALT